MQAPPDNLGQPFVDTMAEFRQVHPGAERLLSIMSRCSIIQIPQFFALAQAQGLAAAKCQQMFTGFILSLNVVFLCSWIAALTLWEKARTFP